MSAVRRPVTPDSFARVVARLAHRFADRDAILWHAGTEESAWSTDEAEVIRAIDLDLTRGRTESAVAFARAFVDARAELVGLAIPTETDGSLTEALTAESARITQRRVDLAKDPKDFKETLRQSGNAPSGNAPSGNAQSSSGHSRSGDSTTGMTAAYNLLKPQAETQIETMPPDDDDPLGLTATMNATSPFAAPGKSTPAK